MRRTPREEAERWLERAAEEVRWAKDLAVRGGYHVACFLARQVGEKALKAPLYARGEEIVVGHSVERLAHEAPTSAPALREDLGRWSILDGYYAPTRRPNSIPARIYTRDAASGAVRLAEEIVEFVREQLAAST